MVDSTNSEEADKINNEKPDKAKKSELEAEQKKLEEQAKKEEEEALNGQKQIDEAYINWSAKLSQYGVQAIYAILVANWAVYNEASKIINNQLSTLSIALCVLSLIANISITWIVTELHYKRCSYSRRNFDDWLIEYRRKDSMRHSKWPYTNAMEIWGIIKRIALSLGPVLAGIAFILSTILPDYKIIK
jgi:hypothetical protein